MPSNHSIFDLHKPDFNTKDYTSDREVLDIVLTRVYTHCTGCDSTTLSSWQLMARGERKGRIFWIDNADEMLRQFPALPRVEWEHTEEVGNCVMCFINPSQNPKQEKSHEGRQSKDALRSAEEQQI